MSVSIQTGDIDVGAILDALAGDGGTGAVASFIGLVRDHGDRKDIVAIELEHYPGMTERALSAIEDEARRRFALTGCAIVHRVGRLDLGQRIVMVAAAAPHRAAALDACAFLIDWLKTKAPFWKREITADGAAEWVAAKMGDDAAAARWAVPRPTGTDGPD
ncbi:molybdenum cofactor biosynthesis protein MoaE [Zavarzinia compransoris]|uniref:molybdenum cofactor biosynthesis protein MoaE n=1 Tax=Zavarzinia marina TaxID=2911065 RepID=UPI001F16DFA3|nr:molybdenum cofactor biosynthesis protein MoaE [Zavarzinia marina]MCF4167683.1 molybdenum cofactor biosynthesis protein MoaE [Zavarzinia marina]